MIKMLRPGRSGYWGFEGSESPAKAQTGYWVIETMKDIPMKPIDKDDEDSDRRMVILAIHKMPKDVNPKLDRPFEKFELYDVSSKIIRFMEKKLEI